MNGKKSPLRRGRLKIRLIVWFSWGKRGKIFLKIPNTNDNMYLFKKRFFFSFVRLRIHKTFLYIYRTGLTAHASQTKRKIFY